MTTLPTGQSAQGSYIIQAVNSTVSMTVARALMPSFRSAVVRMTEDYTDIFGGRDAALAALDAFLAGERPYALLLAPTGRGKTALLIHWVAQVQQAGQWHVVFAPISIRYQTASAAVTLRTLAAALAEVHGEREQFVSYDQTPESMRALAADYLRRPLPEGKRLLVVLDGLDEAVGWDVGRDLFPRTPDGSVRVVCAARQVADRSVTDWLSQLGWRTVATTQLALAELDEAAVRAILRQMDDPLNHLAADVNFVAKIGRVSQGDPLTIRMLVEALRDGELPPGALTTMPPGLASFVGLWLDELTEKSAAQQAILLLLGLCAVAFGPLTKADLAALAGEVFGTRVVLDATVKAVARFLIGNGSEEAGYVFSHPRLRELFGENKLSVSERCDLHGRFVAYGKRWYDTYCHDDHVAPRVPTYLRQFWIAHLVAVEQWAQVCTVLTEVVHVRTRKVQPWAEVRYAAEGSYAGYLTDLDRLWRYAANQNATGPVIRCALISASIRSLSGNIPSELLIGLVAIGTPEGKWNLPAAIEHIRQMPDEWRQAHVIRALALSGEVRDMTSLLALTCGIEDDWARASALSGVVPYLPEGLVGKALVAAQHIKDKWARADALSGVVPYLPEGLVGERLMTALGIESEWARANALAKIAPHLPRGLVGEILVAAWGIAEKKARVVVFAGVAPYLPEGEQGMVWAEALAAARGIEVASLQVSALTTVAPHLPEDVQGMVWAETLAVARKIENKGARAEALARITPYLLEDEQEMVGDEILTVIQQIGNEWSRALALVGSAPHLPKDLARKTLVAARSMRDTRARAEALAGIAPHLVAGEQAIVWSEALTAARAISNKWVRARARAIALVAPHLPEDVQKGIWSEALAAARAIKDDGVRARILTSMVLYLTNDEQRVAYGEALTMARDIEDERTRAEVLAGVAPHLAKDEQEAVWNEALAATQRIEVEWLRAEVLIGIAAHLPEQFMGELLAAARSIGDERARAETLLGMTPHLPKSAQPVVWGEALVSARRIAVEWLQASVLARITPHLPEREQASIWDEVLKVLLGIGDEKMRARALAEVAPYLPEALLDMALIAARDIGDEGMRAWALVGIAPHLPEHERMPVWSTVLAAMRSIGDEGMRARVRIRIAPHLPEHERMPMWSTVLAAMRSIGDEGMRARVLAEVASHLPKEFVKEALITARDIGDEDARGLVLSKVVSQCVSHHLPCPTLLALLRRLATRGRPALLSDLAALMPWIVALTTPEERVEIVQAVRDVALCWP